MNANLIIAIASVAIAGLALFRPEWSRLIRRWTGSIELVLSSRLEIGFSDLGPTLGIHSTIISRNSEFIIENISAEVKRQRDNASYLFSWLAFRGASIAQAPDIQVVTPYVVAARNPVYRNIILNDTGTQDRFKDNILSLRNTFTEELRAKGIAIDPNDPIYVKERDGFLNDGRSDVLDAFNTIQRANYWEEGNYDLEIVVRTRQPSTISRHRYRFSLTGDDVKSLGLNCVVMLRASCYEPNPIYNFAYPVPNPIARP